MAKKRFGLADITALHVLGMLARRMDQAHGIPLALLCQSDEARAETEKLGAEMVERYRRNEQTLLQAREAGNPCAFFIG